MKTRSFTFPCAYCGTVTHSTAEIAPPSGKPGKKITILRYCQEPTCRQPNLITVRDNWDFRPLALGDAVEVLGMNDDGTPILQGKKGDAHPAE